MNKVRTDSSYRNVFGVTLVFRFMGKIGMKIQGIVPLFALRSWPTQASLARAQEPPIRIHSSVIFDSVLQYLEGF